MNFQFSILKHLKKQTLKALSFERHCLSKLARLNGQQGEMATTLTVVAFVLMLTGMATGSFFARRTGRPLEMFPVAEGDPCDTLGEWSVNCTNTVCPTDNNLMVGIPFQCNGDVWENKNPAGECSHDCPNRNPPSPEQRTPTATPIPHDDGECINGKWKYYCTDNVCPDPNNNQAMVGIPFLCENKKWVNKNPAGECTNDCPRPTSSPSTAPTPGGGTAPPNPTRPPNPGAFHLGVEIFTYPKTEGVEFVFHVKFYFDGCDGDINLFRDGSHVAGTDGWGGPDPFVYPPPHAGPSIILGKGNNTSVTYRGTVWNCPNSTVTLEDAITCALSVDANGNPSISNPGCNWNNQGDYIPPGPGPATPGPTVPGGGGTVCGDTCQQCIINNRPDLFDDDSIFTPPVYDKTTCVGKIKIVTDWCDSVGPQDCQVNVKGPGKVCYAECGGAPPAGCNELDDCMGIAEQPVSEKGGKYYASKTCQLPEYENRDEACNSYYPVADQCKRIICPNLITKIWGKSGYYYVSGSDCTRDQNRKATMDEACASAPPAEETVCERAKGRCIKRTDRCEDGIVDLMDPYRECDEKYPDRPICCKQTAPPAGSTDPCLSKTEFGFYNLDNQCYECPGDNKSGTIKEARYCEENIFCKDKGNTTYLINNKCYLCFGIGKKLGDSYGHETGLLACPRCIGPNFFCTTSVSKCKESTGESVEGRVCPDPTVNDPPNATICCSLLSSGGAAPTSVPVTRASLGSFADVPLTIAGFRLANNIFTSLSNKARETYALAYSAYLDLVRQTGSPVTGIQIQHYDVPPGQIVPTSTPGYL